MLTKDKCLQLASRMGSGQWKEAALGTAVCVAHQRNATLMEEPTVLAAPAPVSAAALLHHPPIHPHVRAAISVQQTATQANVI